MSETIDPVEKVLLDADFAPAKAVEPPKRWRNWWRSPEDYYWQCKKCGATGFTAQGTIEADHCLIYPSKDIAISAGSSDSQNYVGAYPDGERP